MGAVQPCKCVEGASVTPVDYIDGRSKENQPPKSELVLPKGNVPLQGRWYSEADRRIIGIIKDGIITWDYQFDEEPTNLYGSPKRGYKMQLGGTLHHATLENGLHAFLHWDDGDSWVRLDPSGNEMCGREMVGVEDVWPWPKCAPEQEEGAHIKLAADLDTPDNLKHPLPHGDDSFDLITSLPILPDLSSEQQNLHDHLELPLLDSRPVLPDCLCDSSHEQSENTLLKMYKAFAIKWQAGSHVKQVYENHVCSDSHMQLMENLMILKLDQNSGCIIEFPMRNVSKVYRMVKYGKRWRDAHAPPPVSEKMRALAQQVVIIEFMKQKIAFMFPTLPEALNFSICFGLLVKRVQQKARNKVKKSVNCGPGQDACMGG